MQALGPRRSLLAAGALVAAAPVLRVLTYFAWPSGRGAIGWMMHTRVDALMVGSFLALLEELRANHPFFCLARRGVAAFAAAVFVVFVSPLGDLAYGGAYRVPLGYSLDAIATAVVLFWAVRNPGSVAGRFLNSRPLVHLGRMSYSLYLWQQPFMRPGAWPLLAAGFAELSHRMVETPMLRLRARFAGSRAGFRPAGPRA